LSKLKVQRNTWGGVKTRVGPAADWGLAYYTTDRWKRRGGKNKKREKR